MSTIDEFDVGVSNENALPTREWLHLTFVFSNFTRRESSPIKETRSPCTSNLSDTAETAAESVKYSIAVYANGALDHALTFRDRVMANSGPM